MPDLTISRDMSSDGVAAALRTAMGEGCEVEPHGDRLLVHDGFWKRALVTVAPRDGTTAVQIRGAGPPGLLAFVIGKLVNERNFAPRVAAALERELAP